MDIQLLYITLITTFVAIIPIISFAIYKQIKKYNMQKQDVLISIDISKVLINVTTNLLLESNIHVDKVKPLSDIIIKAINYIVYINSDCSDDTKLNEGMNLIREVSCECDIKLSVYEEAIIKDVLGLGIKTYNIVRK